MSGKSHVQAGLLVHVQVAAAMRGFKMFFFYLPWKQLCRRYMRYLLVIIIIIIIIVIIIIIIIIVIITIKYCVIFDDWCVCVRV